MIIILDESGDLGFGPNSSRFFVMAATIVHGPNDLDRLTKSVRNKLGRKRGGRELKFNNSVYPIRMLMLRSVAKRDCQIVWVAFDKEKVPLNLRGDKNLLYQMACEAVLREAIKRTLAKKVHVVMDKRYRKVRDREGLEQHVMSIVTKNHTGNFPPKVRISQYDSFMSSELTVHDFIVGAIYQHLERGVDAYISAIESKITFGQRRW